MYAAFLNNKASVPGNGRFFFFEYLKIEMNLTNYQFDIKKLGKRS